MASQHFTLLPVGMDRTDKRVSVHEGADVVKVQPYGCPRNGTMGMCYVERSDNGHFIGLVLQASLVKAAP